MYVLAQSCLLQLFYSSSSSRVCVCLREREKICACDEERERCQNKFWLFFLSSTFLSLSPQAVALALFSFSLSLSGNPTQFTYIPGRRTRTPRRQPARQAIVHNSRTILNFAALPIQIPAPGCAPTTTCLLLSIYLSPRLFFWLSAKFYFVALCSGMRDRLMVGLVGVELASPSSTTTILPCVL